MTDCKDCTTEQGRKDLINTPISITYSKAQFPHLTVTSEDWGVNTVLWLDVGDFLPLGIDADTMQEALIMIAFLQQSTKATLLIDEKMQQELTALSENGIAFNPMKKEMAHSFHLLKSFPLIPNKKPCGTLNNNFAKMKN